MNDICTGIIVKQVDYRENDAIYTVLTKEFGKLSFVANGVKKMKSKNARSLLPYTVCEIHFDYQPNKTMFRLKTSQTRKLFKHCHEDLNLSICLGVACQLADSFVLDEDTISAKKVYDSLLFTLENMEEEKDSITVLTLFCVDLMNIFGIPAEVDGCVHCGKKNVVAFSSKDGGFLCSDCASSMGISFEKAMDLKRFRLLIKGGLQHLDLILRAGGAQWRDLEKMILMIELHAGVYMKSFSLLKGVYQIENNTLNML